DRARPPARRRGRRGDGRAPASRSQRRRRRSRARWSAASRTDPNTPDGPAQKPRGPARGGRGITARMKTPTPEQVRYWRWTRQRVNAAHGASAGEVLAETGWMRSVGGAGPYLGLFARAGLSRAAVDAELAALAIHEL